MSTNISNLIGAVTLAVVIVIAGVAAGQGLAWVVRPAEQTVLTPADDYAIRHLDNLRGTAPAVELTRMDDYGIRLLGQRREAEQDLTPMDDYGIRHLHDDR